MVKLEKIYILNGETLQMKKMRLKRPIHCTCKLHAVSTQKATEQVALKEVQESSLYSCGSSIFLPAMTVFVSQKVKTVEIQLNCHTILLH